MTRSIIVPSHTFRLRIQRSSRLPRRMNININHFQFARYISFLYNFLKNIMQFFFIIRECSIFLVIWPGENPFVVPYVVPCPALALLSEPFQQFSGGFRNLVQKGRFIENNSKTTQDKYIKLYIFEIFEFFFQILRRLVPNIAHFKNLKKNFRLVGGQIQWLLEVKEDDPKIVEKKTQ